MSMVAVTLLAFSALVDCRSSSQSDVEVTLTQKALSFEQKDFSDVEGRIVGGRIVEPAHKYPFQIYFSAGGYACAGSILDTRHILTAAHCLYNHDGVMHEPASCNVWTGAHDRPEAGCGEDIGQRVGVEMFITRDDYNKDTFQNDLAILRLKDDIQMSDDVQPIQLPLPNTTSEEKTALVTGWGGVNPHDPDSPWYQQQVLSCQLLETTLDIIPDMQENCREITYGDSDSKICGFRNGTDSCQGDSGGPLFTEDKGVFTQLGIVSYGYGCATAYPGVYTRLDMYTDWVQNVTSEEPPFGVTAANGRSAAETDTHHFGYLLAVLVLCFVRTSSSYVFC